MATANQILGHSRVTLIETVYFLDRVELHPLEVFVTTSLRESKSLKRYFGSMGIAMRTLLLAIGNVNELPIKLTGLQLNDAIMTTSRLWSHVYYHMGSQMLQVMTLHGLLAKANVMASIELMGGAGTAVRKVGDGVINLIVEPAKAAIQQPETFGTKIGQGTQKFATGLIGGFTGMASSITGTMGTGFAALSFDDEYQTERRRALQLQSAESGGRLASGVMQFGKSVVSGVTGLWEQPIKGGQQNGFLGGMEGVGKGLAGLVFKPVGGAIDMMQSSFAGIESMTSAQAMLKRRRDPRYISPTGVVTPYSWHKAMGLRFMAEACDGKFSDNIYVSHLSEETGKGQVRSIFVLYRSILILTAKNRMGFKNFAVNKEVDGARVDGLRTVPGQGVELWYSDSGTELLPCSPLNVAKLASMIGELVALHHRGHRPVVSSITEPYFPPPQVVVSRSPAPALSISVAQTSEIEVWENERHYPWVGWSSKLLPTDRSAWSSSKGKKMPSRDNIPPSTGWTWSGIWQLDVAVGDGQGWEYAFDFSGTMSYWGSKFKKGTHFVRRRRWVRGQQREP